jgi:hypothetical protein
MPPVPAVRGERIVTALERAGFKVARISGSHHVMRHPDGEAPPCRYTAAVTSRRARYAAFLATSA